ncbi:MAG: thiamine phosphate synthase [Bacteroidota bacterium]
MISRLQYITQETEKYSHAELAEFACKGGVNWVQLRVKNIPYDEWKKIAIEVQTVCKKHGATFIINDNVTLAKEIGADGVHLGLNDMNPKEARKILGNNFIIGGTAHHLEEVKFQIENKVDYIGIGPYRFTSTKNDLSEILGLEGIKEIVETFHETSLQIPFIAIGGIKVVDIPSLLTSGIYGVAVSSAINLAENKSESAEQFVQTISKYHKQNTQSI